MKISAIVFLFFSFFICSVLYAVEQDFKSSDQIEEKQTETICMKFCGLQSLDQIKKKQKEAVCLRSCKSELSDQAKEKQREPAQIEEEDFVPSLSESLNDTNRLKNQVKRQLAEELNTNPAKNFIRKKSRKKPSRNVNRAVSDETAVFGGLEVNVSRRSEEALPKVKDKK